MNKIIVVKESPMNPNAMVNSYLHTADTYLQAEGSIIMIEFVDGMNYSFFPL